MAETILLPLEVIKASTGFALDVSDSVTKLVYRSKNDFKNGEPRQHLAAMGPINLAHFPTDKTEDLLNFLEAECDLTSGADGKHCINQTGTDTDKIREKLEERLNVRTKQLPEIGCSVDALCLLLKVTPKTSLFESVSEIGVKKGEKFVEVVKNFNAVVEADGKGRFPFKDDLEEYDPERGPYFPFLMTLCGSVIDFIRVEEDGTFRVVDSCGIGSSFFHALTSFMANTKNFEEISKLLEESTGKSVDTFGSDLVDPSVSEDVYSSINTDIRAFPFGKGISGQRDKATKGDLVHSLLESVCESVSQLTYAMCQSQHLSRAYVCGYLKEFPKMQEFFTAPTVFRQNKEGDQVNFEYIKHGGFLGAIGAFISAHAQT